MADEIKISALSVAYEKDGNRIVLSSPEQSISLIANSNAQAIHRNQTVDATTTTGVAMDLGGINIASKDLGVCMIRNNTAKQTSETTYILSILTTTAGSKIIEVKPQETAIFRFGEDITAPYLMSSTAGTKVEYVLIEE